MKVYRSNSEDKPKRKLGKKGFLAIGISAVCVVAAIALTLALTLGGGNGGIIPPPDDTPPVNIAPAFVMPVDEIDLGMTFSNQKLVPYATQGGIWETHEGVDFLVTAGTAVKAVSDGTVVSVTLNSSVDGTVIRIQHADGLESFYMGLSSDVKVKEGDTVKAGAVIGNVGIMPIEKLEYQKPHLHLEMKKNGKRVNPLTYLPEVGDK